MMYSMPMSDTPKIVIGGESTPKKAEGTPVRLVGKDYVVRRMKTSSALGLARMAATLQDKKGKAMSAEDGLRVVDSLMKWVDAAFARKDAKAIRDRLDDPDDDLDIEHITELMEAVMEAESENPTT